MFGFEFYNPKNNENSFPDYNAEKCLNPGYIKKVTPLFWQEHCVECAMPLCYKTCEHYKRRADGRCLLFYNGIEYVPNKKAILGRNAIIRMRTWGKLETLFFSYSSSYFAYRIMSGFYGIIAKFSQHTKWGYGKRLFYYIKEYISRKIGNLKMDIPEMLVLEMVNPNKDFTLILESRSKRNVLSRQELKIKKGFSRNVVYTSTLAGNNERINALSLYPSNGEEEDLYIVSLEMVTLDKEYKKRFLTESSTKVKLVVWDLDGTLWDGVISEDGIEGVKIKNDIVELINEFDKKGIINSICSKNDYTLAEEALKKFDLWDKFVAPQVNWEYKSGNIKHLAKLLNLNIDSFVFVDDTENELSEVQDNCPGIRVVHVDDILQKSREEIFDIPITEESLVRRKSYQEMLLRIRDEKNLNVSHDEFLLSCDMKMHINKPDSSEYERCNELIQRTNQLNLSGKRLSKAEMISLIKNPEYYPYRIRVDDRYGDYGLVGFAIFHKVDDVLSLEHFVFSCRAAGKKLEPSFFVYIIEKFKNIGIRKIRLICKKTKKNKLMQDTLLESNIFKIIEKNDVGFTLEVCTDKKDLPNATCAFFED